MNDTISKEDFLRLEDKVDQLHRDYQNIILLAERQKTQGERLGQLEQRMAADEAITVKLDKNVTSWINRGIGVWIAAVAVWTVTNSSLFLSFFVRK